jgi:hypothetical protein
MYYYRLQINWVFLTKEILEAVVVCDMMQCSLVDICIPEEPASSTFRLEKIGYSPRPGLLCEI